MRSMDWPGPEIFAPESIDEETRALNESILARLAAAPDIWSFSLPEIRKARAAGRGSFPLPPPDSHTIELTIEGDDGNPIGLRVMHPLTRAPRGTYLHFHGGGWVMGTARENDVRLRRLVEVTGLSAISVDYRLAPEHPFPAAIDDCLTAALWLNGEGGADFERSVLVIGGESAGAHLAVAVLIALRDRYRLTPFAAANLTAGCFDLSLTPSVRNWGTDKLILNTRDVEKFVEHFVPTTVDRRDPAVSPLYADLTDMPPALFSCGTADLLIDDTLFMASRWLAAGNLTEIDIAPGGCHVFQSFETRLAEASHARIETFINSRIDAVLSR
ncbi:alpha/beta hydrolase [Rhizobium sp. EC-SD404]|uniref:alpha/beta hydrolase n=1 Tax=Rhizobium sp. EC-SD404 TaxID=2038389 RepID=UPI00125C752F|nr:alpha/beta hydrolase [Rhizobium sp. EC-SD404]VVT32628.1 Alpha/beta hydrolase [Rhizobium sp. EC-SD404]